MDLSILAKLPNNLSIAAVEDGALKGPIFQAMFNPETLAITEPLEWTTNPAPGKAGHDANYIKTLGRTFSIDILLDGTGAITNGVRTPVADQLLLFRYTTTKLVGDMHRPNYLLLRYGFFIIDCVLKTSTVTYTLFDRLGVPIRAKLTAAFQERMEGGLASRIAMPSSPDLTHQVIVKEGDTLPLLTYSKYRNQYYYLQVAKANKLTNFRKLRAGTTLIFPPLTKK